MIHVLAIITTKPGKRAEVLEALPFLDHDEGVRTELGAGAAFGIDHRAIFDAALFGVDGRHVGAEKGENLVALAGLRRDDREHMDHFGQLPCVRWRIAAG